MSNLTESVKPHIARFTDTSIASTPNTDCSHEHSGRQFSPVFMRLPSKRQYPDYYDVIKQPIALEEIRMKLDSHKYTSFEELRQDFELCFKNARRYNIRESQIWRDAKTLQVRSYSSIESGGCLRTFY